MFLYYKIYGDTSEKTYAPSQKIPLSEIAQFGVYDKTKGEYVIPFIAYWEEKAHSKQVTVTANIYLDDELEDVETTNVPEDSSIYIDIDSDVMKGIMTDYNWQLFYDEMGSDPFIEHVNEDDPASRHYDYAIRYSGKTRTYPLKAHAVFSLY